MKIERERDVEALDPWPENCVTCGIPDLETFAQGLQKDYSAIKAALTLPYRNGPLEGQMNRLKLAKRSMYGRGSFELLRQRFLMELLLSTESAETPNFLDRQCFFNPRTMRIDELLDERSGILAKCVCRHPGAIPGNIDSHHGS